MANDTALTLLANGVGNAVSLTDGQSSDWQTSTMSIPPSITTSSSYLLSIIINSDSLLLHYDTLTGTQSESDTTNNYTTPTDWGTSTTSARIRSIYATYTSSSFTPSPMMHMMAQSGGLV